MPFAWINGDYVEESTASVPLRDTGLLHGAGVFTTMRSSGGKVFQLARHLRRLRDSCEALFIPLQYKDEELASAAADLLTRNDLADARLRLTVTRGFARQDPLHGLRLEPNVFLTAAQREPYPAEYYERGMTVVLLAEQKLNPYDLAAGHKTLNYLSRLSALREANRRGAGEALWFNVHNYLQSGSVTNVFVVKDGTLLTPPAPAEHHDPAVAAAVPYPKSAVLPGVTRAVILEELAPRAGLTAKPAPIDVNQLLAADEVFLTNSAMDVMPVCRVERKSVGNNKPGPVTARLATLYAELFSSAT